jgi:short-subunit dehydrogenase
VLITGATGGIGSALAKAFDREGARVAIAARQKEKLDTIALTLTQALVLPTDLSDVNQAIAMIDRTVEAFGRIDIFINNAASIIVVPAETVSTRDLIHAFTVNMAAPAAATQQALKYMRTQGGGHIINVGSPGFMLGIPFYSPYVCSKAAFSAWTRTIQAEWAGTAIKISEYFPGYIKTDSQPESRIGAIEQDFLMSRHKNFMARHFAKAQSSEEVAKHLVKLAKHPKTLKYSSFSVKIGAFISNIPSFRLSLARQMAENGRIKHPGI